MNAGPIAKLRQNITTIMAAVSVAAVAIPAARAAELDLVNALRDKGAQIMPLGARGGLIPVSRSNDSSVMPVLVTGIHGSPALGVKRTRARR